MYSCAPSLSDSASNGFIRQKIHWKEGESQVRGFEECTSGVGGRSTCACVHLFILFLRERGYICMSSTSWEGFPRAERALSAGRSVAECSATARWSTAQHSTQHSTPTQRSSAVVQHGGSQHSVARHSVARQANKNALTVKSRRLLCA
jgi:hypothetical protein